MNYLCRDPSHSYECFQTPRRGRGSTSESFFFVNSKYKYVTPKHALSMTDIQRVKHFLNEYAVKFGVRYLVDYQITEI